jgi:hypothetical protein
MDGYTPFPIFDFRSGIYSAKQPWLAPKDAFKDMLNAHVEKGVIRKRKGYVDFGRIVHTDGEEDTNPGNPVMGIIEIKKTDSTTELLAFDTKRMNRYNATTKVFEDLSEADIWTGSESSFYRFCNSSYGDLYITNGVDQIQKYDGSTLAAFDIDTDGDASNDVDTCKWIFEYKDHLVILAPTEEGTLYPARYRCSEAVDYTSWPAANYVDCPTSDEIVSAKFIGDVLFVWFKESLWKLVYVGYTGNPFEWQCVSTEEGSFAPMSTVSLPGNKALTIGKTSVVGTDTYSVFKANSQADDLTLRYSQDKIAMGYAARIRELNQIWFTMCEVGSTSPDAVIAYNYDEGNYFAYDLAFTCFGFYYEAETLTMDDITDAWDSISYAWDDISLQAGFPLILGGTSDGYIKKLNSGYSDDGAAIEFMLEGNEWNPYVRQGLTCRLGYIDIYHKGIASGSLSVDFYANTESTAYKSVILDLSEPEMEKKFTRIKAGAVANFHKIKIYHTQSNQDVQIEMIVPWFRPEGPIR